MGSLAATSWQFEQGEDREAEDLDKNAVEAARGTSG